MEHYFTNNQQLKSELRNIEIDILGTHFEFSSDLGVFSKDKIDYGSRLLILEYIKHHNECMDVLDVGTGYGFIGIVIAKLTGSNVTMIDVNKRAIHLAKNNAKKNSVEVNAFISDVYSNVDKRYDVVITNPPIRAGKIVVSNILINSFEHLRDDGELWFVMRKNHGVKSMIKKLEAVGHVEILNKDNGFYVVTCKKGVDIEENNC